jgi:hypothetical protein
VNEITDAEFELKRFDYAGLFKGDGTALRTKLNALWALIARLPSTRMGDARYWIREVRSKCPRDLVFEYDQYLRELEPHQQREAGFSTKAFSLGLATALNTLRRSERDQEKIKEQETQAQTEDMRKQFNAHTQNEKKCAKCWLRWCPKGENESNQCDVFDKIDKSRIKQMTGRYFRLVNHKRQDKNQELLVEIKGEEETDQPGSNSFQLDQDLQDQLDSFLEK